VLCKKISVIIPAFNAEKYLSRCISSILTQDFINIEVIIVDDGSTDKTFSIAEKYARLDNRVRVYRKINEGVSCARNFALEHVTGDYITFVDSDDYIREHMFSEMMTIAQLFKADLCIGGFDYIFEDNKLPIRCCYKEKFVGGREQFINECFMDLLKGSLINTHCGKIIKSEIIFNNRIEFDQCLNVHEDMLFTLSILKYSQTITVIPTSYYCYWQHSQLKSLNHKYQRNGLMSCIIVANLMINLFIPFVNSNSELYSELRWEIYLKYKNFIGMLYLKSGLSYCECKADVKKWIEELNPNTIPRFKEIITMGSKKDVSLCFLLSNKYYRIYHLINFVYFKMIKDRSE